MSPSKTVVTLTAALITLLAGSGTPSVAAATAHSLRVPPGHHLIGKPNPPAQATASSAAFGAGPTATDPQTRKRAAQALTNPLPLDTSTFFAPPDPILAAGPYHLLEGVNDAYSFWSKNGAEINGHVDFNGFFPIPGTDPDYFTDPWVTYDSTTNRWYMSGAETINSGAQGKVWLAVSQTGDAPTLSPNLFSSTGWHIYLLYSSSTAFCDQPKTAFSADKIVVSCLDFDASQNPLQQEVLVCDKSQAVAGTQVCQEIQRTDRETLIPAAFAFEPGGAFSPPNDLYTATMTDAADGIEVDKIQGSAGAASFVSLGTIPITPLDILPGTEGVPEPLTSRQLDMGDNRLLTAVVQDNVIWMAANTTCPMVGSPTVTLTCLHVDRFSLSPLVKQLDLDLGGDGSYYIYPAIALDTYGNAFVTGTVSSSSVYPSTFAFSIPAGGMGPDWQSLIEPGQGSFSDTNTLGLPDRWGDYAGAATDPADPHHVWLLSEYEAQAGANQPAWATAAVELTAPPLITTVTPDSGPTAGGTAITIRGNYFHPGATVSWNGTPVPATVTPPSTITLTSPAAIAGRYAVDLTVTNADDGGTTTALHGFFYPVFYFAEGYTGPGFHEYLYLFMPGTSGTAQVTYYWSYGGGSPPQTMVKSYQVNAGVTTVVDVNADLPAYANVSAQVSLPDAGVVERKLTFNTSWHGSTDQVGVNQPATQWNFAEGSTLAQFSEYLTLQNPQSTAVSVTLAYQTDNGSHPTKTLSLPPTSRTTIQVFAGDPSHDASGCDPLSSCGVGPGVQGVSVQVQASAAIIAERPFYLNNANLGYGSIADGHDTFGANAASTTWKFAEGNTLPTFSEYLTLQNPGTQAASVSVLYLIQNASPILRNLTVNPQSRTTIQVWDPTSGGAGAGMTGVSATVTSSVPIVAERPMYIVHNFGSGPVAGAHVVVGSNRVGYTFRFAALSTTLGENDFVTIENPNPVAATLTFTYYPNGTASSTQANVPAFQRATEQVFLDVPAGLASFGLVVTSDQGVLVEKPTYSTIPSVFGATDTLPSY